MSDDAPPIIPIARLPSRGGRWLVRAVIGGVVLAGALVLFFYPPESHGFYPRCMLYVMTGWQCPGCGGLRAAHHLLHGEIGMAYHYNALLVLALPFAALWAVAPAFKRRTGLAWLDFTRSGVALSILMVTAVIFGVLRNILR